MLHIIINYSLFTASQSSSHLVPTSMSLQSSLWPSSADKNGANRNSFFILDFEIIIFWSYNHLWEKPFDSLGVFTNTSVLNTTLFMHSFLVPRTLNYENPLKTIQFYLIQKERKSDKYKTEFQCLGVWSTVRCWQITVALVRKTNLPTFLIAIIIDIATGALTSFQFLELIF